MRDKKKRGINPNLKFVSFFLPLMLIPAGIKLASNAIKKIKENN